MSVDLKALPEICERHRKSGDSLVMFLQEIQARYGYLPSEVLKAASREIEVPLARLFGLATFYRSFSLTPRGKHEVSVCTGTACHVRGAATILGHIERRLGVAAGETTEDGEVTLIGVNCLGACALGPVMVVDGKYHGKMTVSKVDEVLEGMIAQKKED
ncbi:MAG TPA: NAD(P)H-dependent oxidoreductase subunit E [Planctomycetota bacterium]|nr:NAD(P)H-dependent oxidoreductase subunit E [Planctomycetota bacterium]